MIRNMDRTYIRRDSDIEWHIEDGETLSALCGEELNDYVYISTTPGWNVDGSEDPVCAKCKEIYDASNRSD